ncbi:MAG TPA: glycosyltransferase family 2 protein [Candidatus Binatia bacterium]|nr:glycosyltransferase family 2 protein [Candidatus Binatia bacterium]
MEGPDAQAPPAPEPTVTAEPAGNDLQLRDIAIVVLNWNRKEETLACLESLAKADLGGASVIVVDNGSRDGSVEAFRERFPSVRLIELERNEGFAGGNNAGMRAALESGAKAVYLLNNDTIVAPDFLHSLLWIANGQERVGAISSVALRMDKPDLLDAAFLDIYFGHGIVWHYGVNALPGEGFDQPREIGAGIGCGMLFLGEALREVGLLDESYFAYHEEVDWCFRAGKAGFRIFYQPFSRIWHHGSRSTDVTRRARPKIVVPEDEDQLPNPVPLSWSPVRSYLGARNAVRFIRKHATPEQRKFFWRSTLGAVPLEYLAAVMGREEEYEIGKWTRRRAAEFFFLRRHGIDFDKATGPFDKLAMGLRLLVHFPIDLFWTLPRLLWVAHRDGHVAQPLAEMRGLWDGFLDRPLPLEKLGLR